MRDGVHGLQVGVGTALDNAAADLHFFVRICEVDNRQCDSRIAARVLTLERVLSGINDEVLAFPANPDRNRSRRAVRA